ncbi:MAG TPA: hypothetical protein VFH73_11755 [Polyangia bacterium]|nr:hypothetical protein [Polyangia bacterium]
MNLLACSTDSSVDIGGSTGSKLSDYAAEWDGHAEAYKFDATSDRIRIMLSASGEGTLQVADHPLFPPATDPNVGYPVGEAYMMNIGIPTVDEGLRHGFEYPIHNARIDSERLRFYVDTADPFQHWCELHPKSFRNPAYMTEIRYQCVTPDWNFLSTDPSHTQCYLEDPNTHTTDTSKPIDCGMAMLCAVSQMCACTETACTSAHKTEDAGIAFDASLEMTGSKMVGTIVVHDGTRVTVRLTRK